MLGSLLSNIHHVTNVEQFEKNTVQHCICCLPFSQSELIKSSKGMIKVIVIFRVEDVLIINAQWQIRDKNIEELKP